MDNTSAPTLTQKLDQADEKAAEKAWQARVEMHLAILGKKAETITYEALARSADIPAPHRIHKLTNFLESLIAEDISANSPIRAALVISKVRGLPAPGFFDAIRACGMNVNKTDELACHHKLLSALNPAFQSQSA